MKFTNLFAAIALVLSTAAVAQTSAADHAAHHVPATASTTPVGVAMVDGEVRKIDKDQGKITLRHGPIANLEMPAMTMVFKVADPKLLDSLKEGDKVKFAADKVNGAITVTAVEPVK